MRFVRTLLALVFALAMVGPEVHACPVHSGVPASHHQENHQQGAHCTCPQACCPTAVSALLASGRPNLAVRAPVVGYRDADRFTSVLLVTRKHVLPLALAPPQHA